MEVNINRDVLDDIIIETGAALELIRAQLAIYGNHLQGFTDKVPADFMLYDEFCSVMLRLTGTIEKECERLEHLIERKGLRD